MDKDMKDTKQKLTDAIENVESVLKQIIDKMSDDKKKYDDEQISQAKKAVENAMKNDEASLVLVHSIDKDNKPKECLVAVRGTKLHALAMLCSLVIETIENIDVTPEEFAKVLVEGSKKCRK